MRRFQNTEPCSRPLAAWIEGDDLTQQLIMEVNHFRELSLSNQQLDEKQISATKQKVAFIDANLTRVENEFSGSLGEISRWLEKVLILFLIFIVLSIGSICIGLVTFFLKRTKTFLD